MHGALMLEALPGSEPPDFQPYRELRTSLTRGHLVRLRAGRGGRPVSVWGGGGEYVHACVGIGDGECRGVEWGGVGGGVGVFR